MFKKWFGRKKNESATPPESERLEETIAEESPSPSGEAMGDSIGDSGAASATIEEGDETAEESGQPRKSRWSFLSSGFKKTRERLAGIFRLKGKLDEDALDSIEAALYGADFGPAMVDELVEGENGLRAAWKRDEISDQEHVLDFLKRQLKGMLQERPNELAENTEGGPTVFLVAGVNGVGKTTSIAKIANRLLKEGRSVMLVAGDTFRAAAVEQLTIWSQRLGVEIVTGKERADPASVAYAGIERALEIGVDYVVVDTAGRLHTDKNLMRQLHKIRGVIEKKLPGAPHESLLVLDATNGQNAIQQATAFKREVDITGIVLTKLDGTAKGGVVFAIHNELEIPVKLVGIGEQMDDMSIFDPESFVDALFED